MELRPYSEDDLWLTEALECDATVMMHLGGPLPREDIPRIHRRRVQSVAADPVDYFTIIPNHATGPVGTVAIWETDWHGSKIHETGWMILPAFQGKGIASSALQMVLDRVRADGCYEQIHAFPSISNVPSNAMCRKFGFSLIEECDVESQDRKLRSNHWRLDLT